MSDKERIVEKLKEKVTDAKEQADVIRLFNDVYIEKDTEKGVKSSVDERIKEMIIDLKGKARIVPDEKLNPEIKKAWEHRIAGRITSRVIRNVQGEKGHPRHPEAHLPEPEYLILMEAEEIVNLSPHPLR